MRTWCRRWEREVGERERGEQRFGVSPSRTPTEKKIISRSPTVRERTLGYLSFRFAASFSGSLAATTMSAASAARPLEPAKPAAAEVRIAAYLPRFTRAPKKPSSPPHCTEHVHLNARARSLRASHRHLSRRAPPPPSHTAERAGAAGQRSALYSAPQRAQQQPGLDQPAQQPQARRPRARL